MKLDHRIISYLFKINFILSFHLHLGFPSSLFWFSPPKLCMLFSSYSSEPKAQLHTDLMTSISEHTWQWKTAICVWKFSSIFSISIAVCHCLSDSSSIKKCFHVFDWWTYEKSDRVHQVSFIIYSHETFHSNMHSVNSEERTVNHNYIWWYSAV